MPIIQSSIVSIAVRSVTANLDFDAVFEALQEPAAIYPGFRPWFYGSAVAGVETGERKMFVAFARDWEIGGVVIAKRSSVERKLCTVWVRPELRNSGVAAELATDALDWLGTEKPLFTVTEDRVSQFGGLLRAWGFGQPQRIANAYRDSAAELVFNGSLKPHCVS
jgi:hypothetical protein